jgi:serine/threonine-protein kinase
MAVPFDPRTLKVLGAPVALMPEIALGRGDVPAFAFSRDGTLVFATGYLPFSRREPLRLVRKERSGEATPLPFAPDLFLRGAAVSPDGARLLATTWGGPRWVFDLARGTRAKLPGDQNTSGYRTAWTPDGQRVAFSGVSPGQPFYAIFVQSVDGAGAPEILVEPQAGREQFAAGWTPDGALVFWAAGRPGEADTLFGRIRPGSAPEVIWSEGGGVAAADISPDGRWVAFDSDASGDFQIYAMPPSTGGPRLAVTASGGRYPVWSRDGRELFYRRDHAFYAVSVRPQGPGLEFGPEEHLFDWDSTREFSVGPDGSFFGTERVPGAAEQRLLQLRTGWFAEVERLAGGAR